MLDFCLVTKQIFYSFAWKFSITLYIHQTLHRLGLSPIANFRVFS